MAGRITKWGCATVPMTVRVPDSWTREELVKLVDKEVNRRLKEGK